MTEGLELIEKLYDLSPHLVLVVAINFVLWGLKRAPMVPDWTLPFIAMTVGCIVYPFIAEVGRMSYEVRSPRMFLHLFGAALGGTSVCLNQIFRQLMRRFGLPSGDTELIRRTGKTRNQKNQKHHRNTGFPVPAVLMAGSILMAGCATKPRFDESERKPDPHPPEIMALLERRAQRALSVPPMPPGMVAYVPPAPPQPLPGSTNLSYNEFLARERNPSRRRNE